MKSFFSNIFNKLKAIAPSRRKIIQLYTALLFNANVKGFASGKIYTGNTKKICVPGLNCYSCPGAVGACPLGSLQGSFSADRSTLYYVFGILFLYGVLFGRMICGWFCPFGLVQELFYKIKTPKLKKDPVTRILSLLKYIILVFFVFIVPIIYAFRDTPLPAFCKYICPAGTLEGGLGILSNKVNESYLSMLGPLFTWKFLLLVSIVAASVFIFRFFCRFICPLGALYGLFNKISVFGVKLEKSKCTECNLCVSKCKLDIKEVGDRECISCGECINVCPAKAISWKGSKIFLKANESVKTLENNLSEEEKQAAEKKYEKKRMIARFVAAVLMLALLIGAIVYFWNDTSKRENASTVPPVVTDDSYGESDYTYGTAVGNKCYGADLKIMSKDGISEATLDPASLGKITVINFWGTWCTPCVNELPYFDRIAEEYKDEVAVVAVHGMAPETAPEFIEKYYAESEIVFLSDYGDVYNNGYYTLLGGTNNMYPYTVVIDEDGIIAASYLSSVNYDMLKAVIDEELK